QKGILLMGSITDAQVTGNLVWGCSVAGIQIEDPASGSGRTLIANNTIFDSGPAFRVWDNAPFEKPSPGQVEVRNNLLFGTEKGSTMAFVLDPRDGGATRPGDVKSLNESWRFDHNWRDVSGSQSGFTIPLAPGDRAFKDVALLSRLPHRPDFMRPPADSPLAAGGAGREDVSLPVYVGAVPPQGVEPWDWDNTWKARVKKLQEQRAKPRKEQEKPQGAQGEPGR